MTKEATSPDPLFQLASKRVKQLRKAIATEACESAVMSAKLVHDLRVCTKQLRALLQLYRPNCSKVAIKEVEQQVKTLADSCAFQRDAHVQYALLGQANQHFNSQQQNDMQPLREHFLMLSQRPIAHTGTVDVSQSCKHILQAWRLNLACNTTPDLTSGLNMTYRKSRKLAHAAQVTDDDDVYHQCRKWLKYYLYQLQMLSAAKGSKDKGYIKQLVKLADKLGQLHDRCVMEQTLGKLCVDAGNLAKQKIPVRAMQPAISLMLSWLAEQKRKDKDLSLVLFTKVFSHSCPPVSL